MLSSTIDVETYLASLPAQRQQPMTRLREVILAHLPAGFEEVMAGGMPSYVVPLTTFPQGYHCTPNTPLPFLGFASRKNFVSLHHFGMYVDSELMQWFVDEYPKHMSTKLDMGKSCVRFKRPDKMPFDLIAELVAKRSVDDWLTTYQRVMKAP